MAAGTRTRRSSAAAAAALAAASILEHLGSAEVAAFVAAPSPPRRRNNPPPSTTFAIGAGTRTDLRMSTDVEPDQDQRRTEEVGPETEPEPWWRSFELRDSALPSEIRPHFPILNTRIGAEGTAEEEKKHLVYLDSAATSQKPVAVTGALTRYYHETNSNVHRGAHCLSREATSQYEGARDAIADFVNAYSRNEIVFTSGATEAINLVAQSYGRTHFGPGDEVIVSELEHHSNIVPWQMVTETTGAALKFVPVNRESGTLDVDVLESLLNENTKFVSLQHVSNVMGCVHPIDAIISLVRTKSPSAKILLDACQSVPHMPVDVRSLDADFLAASGHKMCGPTGIGFLWGREDLLNSIPPFLGGGEMIDEVTTEGSTYARSPARFEAGTPAIAQAVGLGAAVEYLRGVGIDRIEAYEHELGAYLYRRLREVEGVTPLGPEPDEGTGGKNRVGLVSFVCDDVHPSDLSTFLDMEGVAIRAGHHCCQPLHRALGYSHSARASLYFYNTKEEIDFFIKKLEETLSFFRSVGGDGGGTGGDDNGFVPFI